MQPTMELVVAHTRSTRRRFSRTRISSYIWIIAKVEVKDSRSGPISLTRRFRIINPKINSKAIRRQMEIYILRVTMGFTLLKKSWCASIARVVGLIPHTPLASMIHGPIVYKIINPSPFLLPIYFKSKWYKQAAHLTKLLPIMDEEHNTRHLSMVVLILLLSTAYTIWVLTYFILSMQFKKSRDVNIKGMLSLILNSFCSFPTYKRPGI